jgi:imidazolonepropionase-like amidohydrolase
MIRIALLLLLAIPADSEDAIALVNARIVPVKGDPIARGVVLVRNGKIAAVGADTEVPEGARVIDLSGKTIIPGLINGASAVGVAGTSNEDGEEIAPTIRILDSFDPRSADLSRCRQSGVTALMVEPGNRGVIGGLGAVVKTAGESRKAMTLRADAALKAAMGLAPTQGNSAPRGAAASFFNRRPTTRMGVAWEFRKAFFDGQKAEDRDPAGEILKKALSGALPVRISAVRVTDIETALQVAEELKLRISLEEAQEAYKRADLLAKRRVPVLLRPVPPPAGSEPEEYRLDTFTQLIRAGVQTALLPSADSRSEGLLASTAFAVRYGAEPGDALRAVTLTPAEILGVADRVGSLEPGKDADLVVLSGPPHQITTRVEKVMVDGRWVYGERSQP